MRYAAFYDGNGKITSIAIARQGGEEITRAQYDAYLAEIAANVPDEPVADDEIDDSEALSIILGGATA